MSDATDAIGIREQAIVQIVEMQNSEPVNGTLPAAGQQENGGN